MRKLLSIGCCAALLMLAACGNNEKSSRGIVYMPDMYDSPAQKSQQVMTVVLDAEGKPIPLPVMTEPESVLPESGVIHQVPVMLTPPAGSVSRHFVGYPYGALDFAGSHDLVNPVLPTASVLMEGQKRFRISCAPCHGNDGDALNSYVGHKFTGIPSLNTPVVGYMSDGDLYHIVTMGRGRMPHYRAQLMPEQRWAVVHYVKLLNRTWNATVATEERFKTSAEAYAKKPDDEDLKRDFEAAKESFERTKVDLDLIEAGTADWKAFVPPREPRPEYVKPAWPEN